MCNNPDEPRKNQMSDMLSVCGAKDDNVEVISDSSLEKVSDRYRRLVLVGRKVVDSAVVHASAETQKAIKAIRAKDPDISTEDILEDEKVKFWLSALERLGVDLYQDTSKDCKPSWSYYVLSSDHPYNCINALFPQRIILTMGVLDMLETDEELAVVIGHELAHVILDHAMDRAVIPGLVLMGTVSLIGLIRTFGKGPFIDTTMIAGLGAAMIQGHSQRTERQADDLGLKLALDASFDGHSGIECFKKLHEHRVSKILAIEPVFQRLKAIFNVYGPIEFLRTHPPTLGRFKRLKTQLESQEPYRSPPVTLDEELEEFGLKKRQEEVAKESKRTATDESSINE